MTPVNTPPPPMPSKSTSGVTYDIVTKDVKPPKSPSMSSKRDVHAPTFTSESQTDKLLGTVSRQDNAPLEVRKAVPHTPKDAVQAKANEAAKATSSPAGKSAPVVYASAEAAMHAINSVLQEFLTDYSYDRIVNVAKFAEHIMTNPPPLAAADASERIAWRDKVRKSYDPGHADSWLQEAKGGNCQALSVALLRRIAGDKGSLGCHSSCLIGSNLKQRFNVSMGGSGLNISHVGCLIGFNIKDRKEPLQVIADPGFNATEAFEVPDSDTPKVVSLNPSSQWVVSREKEASQAGEIPGLRARILGASEKEAWEKPDMDDTDRASFVQQMTATDIKTDPLHYANFSLQDGQESVINDLTKKLAPVDIRPVLLARDEKGNVTANITIDFKHIKASPETQTVAKNEVSINCAVVLADNVNPQKFTVQDLENLSVKSFALQTDSEGKSIAVSGQDFLNKFQRPSADIIKDIRTVIAHKDLLAEFHGDVRADRARYTKKSNKVKAIGEMKTQSAPSPAQAQTSSRAPK